MAAVLACGEGAALSHQTAAAAWDLRRAGGDDPRDGPGPRRAQGAARSAAAPQPDAHRARGDRVRGMPVTTVARTIIDLSRTRDRGRARGVGPPRRRPRPGGLPEPPGSQIRLPTSGVANLRPGPDAQQTRTRASCELCRDHGITRPEVNAVIDGYLVDFVWRDRKLIVEVDGYEHHRSRASSNPTASGTSCLRQGAGACGDSRGGRSPTETRGSRPR